STGQVERALLGIFEREGDSCCKRGQCGQAKDQNDRGQKHRETFTRLHLALVGPTGYSEDPDDGDQDCHGDDPGAFLPQRLRQEESAAVEIGSEGKLNTVAWCRKHRQYAEIPEENDEKRRNIAEYFHINHANLGNQPVSRQASDTNEESENGSRDDAHHSDKHRVEQADYDCPSERGVSVEIDQRLRHVKAATPVQKTIAGRNVRAAQIFNRVPPYPVNRRRKNGDDQNLKDDAPYLGIIHPGNTSGIARVERVLRCHAVPLVRCGKRTCASRSSDFLLLAQPVSFSAPGQMSRPRCTCRSKTARASI